MIKMRKKMLVPTIETVNKFQIIETFFQNSQLLSLNQKNLKNILIGKDTENREL